MVEWLRLASHRSPAYSRHLTSARAKTFVRGSTSDAQAFRGVVGDVDAVRSSVHVFIGRPTSTGLSRAPLSEFSVS